ncbi:MAG: glucosaminidase domain-containing protein [Gammaproteobacteria bacterium]|nr:glucosaminidase domain-containing protein [Gammaproteobacteria bacterium]
MSRIPNSVLNKKPQFIAVLIVVLVLAVLVIGFGRESMPDFSEIEDIPQRKQAFISYLAPTINDINQERAQERAELKAMIKKMQQGESLGFLEELQLEDWAERYGLDYQEDAPLAVAEKLLLHLDQIPLSMVLAQAAMESAWGTSRFAIEGNNLFGQWCFEEGCGIVPSQRNEGASHEVQVFDSVKDAIASYFRNINSHRAYRDIREMRAMLRAKDRSVTGFALVEGLHSYSQRGQAYIDELRSVISYNDLDELNTSSASQGS